MKTSQNLTIRRLLILGAVIIILLLIWQVVYTNLFNQRVYTAEGPAPDSATYLYLNPRDDSTSTWLKRDFRWKDISCDLKAQTIDGIFYNRSFETVSDWSMEIRILDNCFLNNAWCGTVEIHQYAGTEREKVQTLDLRNYSLEEVALEHYFDGDLLIPLQKGDSVIYTPSVKDSEVPIGPQSELTMGMIFYYYDSLDFLQYQIRYQYHRELTQGNLFSVIFLLGIIWSGGLALWLITGQIYKNAQMELELRKSGIACMSDIYHAIYIVDLTKDELIPVFEKTEGYEARPQETRASEQIRHLFELDADDAYRDVVLEFCDLKTLPGRLGERKSVAAEYYSKSLGWCSIRFFSMERIEGRELDQVLFTLQVIDEEKREMDAIEQRINLAERENRERNSFLETVSEEMLTPVQRILALTEPGPGSPILTGIRRETLRLEELINDSLDTARLMTDRVRITNQPFRLPLLLEKVRETARELMGESAAGLKYDCSASLLNGSSAMKPACREFFRSCLFLPPRAPRGRTSACLPLRR